MKIIVRYLIFFIPCLPLLQLYADSSEYLYPIGTVTYGESSKVCVLHQKNMKLQPWFWDPHTKRAWKVLPALYNAANFQLLPSGNTFSFIHNDVVHVKELSKRSPQIIDFYGPYDITQIYWDTDTSFYFSGFEDGHRKIFYKDCNSEFDDLVKLAQLSDGECVFPQKIGNELFYIEHTSKGESQLVKKPYIVPLKHLNNLFFNDGVSTEIILKSVKDVLYVHDVQNEKLGFFHMISSTSGIFLSYSTQVSKDCKIACKAFECSFQEGNFKIIFLFSFNIPLSFLIGKKQFYESMYVFIPRYYQNRWYFVTCDSDVCILQSYSLVDRRYQDYVITNQIISPPIQYEERMYYGGQVSKEIALRQIESDYYMELPYIDFVFT